MNFNNMSDQELLYAFGNGTPEVESEIYKRYYPEVKKICSRCLRGHCHDDVSEAIQLVFVHLLVGKKLLKFRGEAPLKCWMQVVAKNVCFTCLRQMHQERNYPLPENDYLSEQDYPWKPRYENVLQTIEQAEKNAQVREILDELTPDLRAAVWLRYYACKSYKESAKIMGVSVSYFGVCLNRAVKKMRVLLDEPAMKGKQETFKPAKPGQGPRAGHELKPSDTEERNYIHLC